MAKLKAQTPALGILKTHDFGDSMYYTIVCQCGSPDDMIDFSVELAADEQSIELHTVFTPKTAYWQKIVNDTSNFDNSWLWSIDYSIRYAINSFYHRLQVTWEVWTHGYVKYHQTTIMSEQQALNYAAIINQSIEDLRKFKQVRDAKRND